MALSLVHNLGLARLRHASSQRSEVKFLISEPAAMAIRSFVEPFVTRDPHAPEYIVNSLYLDTPDLRLFFSSDRGEKNRFKLRIRSYASTECPVFCEIKQRIDQVNRKLRAAVRPEALEGILHGRLSLQSALLDATDPAGAGNLLQFRDLIETMSAAPTVAVRYRREALVGRFENHLRITFDRNVSGLLCREYAPDLWTANKPWLPLDMRLVILEIKFNGSFPNWLAQLASHFNLRRISFSKYVECFKMLDGGGFPIIGSGVL